MSLNEILSRFIDFFGGLPVVLCGLALLLGTIWRHRIRDREAAKLRIDLERLKSDLAVTQEQSTYMHKVRFDIEFKIYSELWPKLRAVRDACARLVFTNWPEEQRPPDDLRSDLTAAVKALGDVVEDQRPFFSADIASALFRLMEVTKEEAERDAEFRKTRDPDPMMKGITIPHRYGVLNLRNIQQRCDHVCELIRSRITGAAQPPELVDQEPIRAPSRAFQKIKNRDGTTTYDYSKEADGSPKKR